MASAEEVQQRVNLQGTADSSKCPFLIRLAIFIDSRPLIGFYFVQSVKSIKKK